MAISQNPPKAQQQQTTLQPGTASGYPQQQQGGALQPPTTTNAAGVSSGPVSQQQQTQQNFLGSNLTAPSYNEAGVAGNVGTAYGANVPAAAQFQQQLFNPQLNTMEQSFLNAGTAAALPLQEQALNTVQNQFEQTPFSSALAPAELNAGNQFAENLVQQSAQLGLQREQTAAGLSNSPGQMAEASAAIPVQAAAGLYGEANNAFQQAYQQPNSVYQQEPISAPQTVIQPTGSQKF